MGSCSSDYEHVLTYASEHAVYIVRLRLTVNNNQNRMRSERSKKPHIFVLYDFTLEFKLHILNINTSLYYFVLVKDRPVTFWLDVDIKSQAPGEDSRGSAG